MSKKVIWKFELSQATPEIEIQEDFQILSIQMQHGVPCLWASLTPDLPTVKKVILFRGTGQSLRGDEGNFLGTIQQGPFVWHFFEEKK